MAKCPARNFHRKEEFISQNLGDENQYKCTCGCVFEWIDDFHWKVLTYTLQVGEFTYHHCCDLCTLSLRCMDGKWYIIPNTFGDQQIPIKFCPWCGEKLEERS